jgi:hypothetical protein
MWRSRRPTVAESLPGYETIGIFGVVAGAHSPWPPPFAPPAPRPVARGMDRNKRLMGVDTAVGESSSKLKARARRQVLFHIEVRIRYGRHVGIEVRRETGKE